MSCACFRLGFLCNLKGGYVQNVPKFVSVLETLERIILLFLNLLSLSPS